MPGQAHSGLRKNISIPGLGLRSIKTALAATLAAFLYAFTDRNPANHIAYALNRMFDTGVGVVVALVVNLLLPRQRLERWLRLSPTTESEESQ